MNPQAGSSTFHELLYSMAKIHEKKSHDYTSNDNPYGNYHFAGMLSKLFTNPADSGFVGRLGEKIYRLANLENNHLTAKNESIEDTEMDICVIVALWVASRRDSRINQQPNQAVQQATEPTYDNANKMQDIARLLGEITPKSRIELRDYLVRWVRDDDTKDSGIRYGNVTDSEAKQADPLLHKSDIRIR